MLLIDYGLGEYSAGGQIPEIAAWVYRRFFKRRVDDLSRHLAEFALCCRLGHFPAKNEWAELGDIFLSLCSIPGSDVSDLATQLYYYHTHRRQLSPVEYKAGMIGYTGIMQELEDEVPLRGPARLIRKLSVDVNFFIPNYIASSSRRKTLVTIAESIAARYDLCIVYLENGNS